MCVTLPSRSPRCTCSAVVEGMLWAAFCMAKKLVSIFVASRGSLLFLCKNLQARMHLLGHKGS